MKPVGNKQQAGRTGLLICGSLALLLILLLLVPAHASFTVQPIRVELSADQQVFALRVRNTSQQEISIQLEVKDWQQLNGSDIYTNTAELLAVPPIFSIAANQTQTVRVGLRRAPDPNQELSYRVYLRELPAANDASGGVKMALNVGVPVFVRPVSGRSSHELQWQSNVNEDGERILSVINHGNGHAQITRLHGVAQEHEFTRTLNHYVLPGARREWVLPSDFASSENQGVQRDLQLKARVNGNEQSSTVQLD